MSKMEIEIIENKDLSDEYKEIINNSRVSNWGIGAKKNFSKDYESKTLWIFINDNNQIVSFGGIRPLKLKFLDETYNIGGICSTISIKKGCGYGSVMINTMKNYSKKSGKTLLGFTTQTEFFRKSGIGTENGFIKRFVYKKENGDTVYDNEGDGIYIEGKDELISKILETNEPVFTYVDFW